MADKAKSLLQRLHLKPSTTLKVSKTAVFILLGLISVQTVAGGLLWYADRLKAASDFQYARSFGSGDGAIELIHKDRTGNVYYVYEDYKVKKYSSIGDEISQIGAEGYDEGQYGGVSGLQTDSLGNLYVLDSGSSRVLKYSSGGAYVSTWGSYGTGDGQFATTARLAISDTDEVYVVDTGNSRVQKFTTSGVFVTKWGSPGSGTGQFTNPWGITTDSSGMVYVSEGFSGRIQKFSSTGVYQTSWTVGGYGGDLVTGPGNVIYATSLNGMSVKSYNTSGVLQNSWGGTGGGRGTFGGPYLSGGITIDASGNVLVADVYNAHVQQFSSTGAYQGVFTGLGKFAGPSDVATDTTYMYVAVQNKHAAYKVRKSDGRLMASMGTSQGSGNGQFSYPMAIDVGPDGSIYVLDGGGNNRVQKFDANGNYVLQWGSTGSGNGQLNSATGMTVAADGSVYVIDVLNQRIQKFDANGNYVLQWGSAGTGDGEFDLSDHFGTGPNRGIDTDASGNVYVTDTHNQRVQKFTSNGVFITKWGGVFGDGEGQFKYPHSLTVDSANNVYVSCIYGTGERIQKFNSSGVFLYQYARSQGSGDGYFNDPEGIEVDENGSLFVADHDNNIVQQLDFNYYLSISNSGGGSGTVGEVFSTFVTVDDPQGPLTFSLASGELPPGLSLNSSTGEISGTPTLSGWYYATIEVTDGQTTDQTSPNFYIADPVPDPLVFTSPSSLPNARVGVAYSQQIQVDNEIGNVYFNLLSAYSTNLGLSFNEQTATVSGTPTAAGTYEFSVEAYDDRNQPISQTFYVVVDPPISIETFSLESGTVGVAYEDFVNTANAQGGVTYSVTAGSLPSGLSLNPSTGFITGTPLSVGTSNFTVRAQDSNTQDSQALSITIGAQALPINITTIAISDKTLSCLGCGDSFTDYIYVENNVGAVDFSVTDGTLPPGMSLGSADSDTGMLSGIPTTLGTYVFTVQAQDSRGAPDGLDTQQYSVTITTEPAINITTTSLSNARDGLAYNTSIAYGYAQAQPVFSLVSGSLPPGMSLTLEGYLEGTPTAVGEYVFTVEADDGFTQDTQQLVLTVDPAPVIPPNTPFVTITSPGNNATFTGGSSVITGTGPANQTITIFIDNQQVGTTTANAQGTWTYNATGIAAGNHTLDAKWIPGAEVMFRAVVDADLMTTSIQAYDTSTDQIVKTIYLPAYSAAWSVLVYPAGDKIMAYGVDLTSTYGGFWVIDLQTASISAYNSEGQAYPSDVAITPDGSKTFTAIAGGVTASTTSGTFLGNISLGLPTNVWVPSVLNVSEDGTKLYAYVGVVSPFLFSGSLSETAIPYLGKLYTIDTSTLQVIDTFDTVDNTNWQVDGYVLPFGFAYANGVAYVAASDYTPEGQNFGIVTNLSAYNIASESLMQTKNVSAENPGEDVILGGGYVDRARNNVYFRQVSVDDNNTTLTSSIIKWNVAGNSIEGLDLDSSSIQGGTQEASLSAFWQIFNLWSWGIDNGDDDSKLYISMVRSGGQSSTDVISLGTGQLLQGAGYPISHGSFTSFLAFQFGSNFIGPITPPQDSIAFSVPQGTTPPPTCQETNTCPPADCTTTNTCPPTEPPTCQQTGTCPTVTDPETPTTPQNPTIPSTITPTIVNTPLPNNLTPTTSRLGWFDRSVLSLARFIPEQAAIGFPYLLFVLMLIFALSLYYQSSNEIRKDALNKQFLAKRKSIRAQQDNFIALASHYLNTPITIIQGGVENEERKR